MRIFIVGVYEAVHGGNAALLSEREHLLFEHSRIRHQRRYSDTRGFAVTA